MATIEEKFEEFHQQNPAVYDELVRLARLAKSRGHSRYSVDLLLAVVRFRRDMRLPVVRDTSGFRLNNNFTSRYARRIQQQEQDLSAFFETRVLRSE